MRDTKCKFMFVFLLLTEENFEDIYCIIDLKVIIIGKINIDHNILKLNQL